MCWRPQEAMCLGRRAKHTGRSQGLGKVQSLERRRQEVPGEGTRWPQVPRFSNRASNRLGRLSGGLKVGLGGHMTWRRKGGCGRVEG